MTRRRPPAVCLVLWSLAALVPLAVVALDACCGHDVTLLHDRRDAAQIEEWRALRDPSDDPAEIYGQPQPGSRRRVLLLPWMGGEVLVRIEEDPDRRLLFVDEHPGLHLIDPAALGLPALGLGAVLALVGWGVVRRRSRRPGAPVRPAP